MIKAVIFDNNGVLTLSDKENTVANFAKYFNIEETELHKVFDKFAEPLDDGSETTLQFYQKIADHFGRTFVAKDLEKVHIESYIPKDHMREMVLNLRKTHTVALLTNFGDAYDKANAEIWHYDEVFDKDKQFVSCKLGMRKPNQDIYEYSIKSLGVRPDEVIFVDDREANLVPARELGMGTLLFVSPEQCKNELQLLLGEVNG